ncbi:MAG: penicillin-insensitive murein endopeptidase [Nitrospirae bacterium]|nr:penicillin-insensitive murein endopeptidase [Nitrospirota bacterium]
MSVLARYRKYLIFLLSVAALLAAFIYYGNSILIQLENDNPSVSVGTYSDGRLMNGKRLPTRGANYRAYSYLGTALGRNTVNDKVRDAIVEAYGKLAVEYPAKTFVYGETGWPHGGRFRPHKTHRNGLSVDFMVPIIDANGKSVPLPASVLNKFGYGIEFDKAGKWRGYRIDFDAMSAHIDDLDFAARRHGLRIDRVIFDNGLQQMLFKSAHGKVLAGRLRFSKKPSWVRHDEHYHVDFKNAD